MTANTNPVFPLTPVVPVGQTVITANTAKDGTGTMVTVYTAGANGSKVGSLQIAYTGTSVATCLRIFLNNGSTNATAGNNSLLLSVTVPANTLSEVAAANDITVPLNLTLPAGYKLNVAIGTTIAAALAVTANGGDL